MTSGPQRQVIKQPNGTERVSYRDSDGKFISKSTYEKLLGQAAESLRSQVATPADHLIKSDLEGKAPKTGGGATKKSERDRKPTSQVEPEESSTRNVALALDDLIEFIKEERPLIHDFIHLNVELLKNRVRNNTMPNVPPAPASNSTSGGIRQDSPLDPDKEREKNIREKVRSTDSDVRDKVREIAQTAHRLGERPTFVNAPELAHRPLHDLDLHDADFSGSNLTGTDLSSSNLTGANLSGKKTNLTSATMMRTNCESANFDEATLDGIQMQHVNLSEATLRKARLQGAQLNDVNLERADLSGADLSGATLKKVCLRETNLDGITIDNAITFDPDCQPILEVACWENPDPATVKGSFKDAILRGANFSCLDLTGSDFSRANLDRARLHDTCLQNATFEEANLEGANLQRAQLKNAHMNSAYLGNAKLRHANLSNADLTNANLTNANLILADLTNADLSRANLRSARVSQAQLDSAKSLTDAIMPDGSIHP